MMNENTKYVITVPWEFGIGYSDRSSSRNLEDFREKKLENRILSYQKILRIILTNCFIFRPIYRLTINQFWPDFTMPIVL